jgi:hypothetical protein
MHEEMFSIISHQANVNQNYIEISSDLNQNGYHQENKQQLLARMWRERNHYILLVRM